MKPFGLLIIKIALCTLPMICLFGCNSTEKITPESNFKRYYSQLRKVENLSIDTGISSGSKVTLSAFEMPLLDFVRYCSEVAGISIVCNESLDRKTVTIDVVDVDVSDVLSSVARRINSELSRSGQIYYLGSVSAKDKALLVRKVNRFDSVTLKSAVEVLLGEYGSCEVFDGGLLVVGDRVEVLERIHSLIDKLESAPFNSWVVQLFVLNARKGAMSRFGIETDSQIAGALTMASFSDPTADYSGMLSSLLIAEQSSDDIKLITQPMFVLLDGTIAMYNAGQRYPIAKKSMNREGIVVTTGYDYEQTGMIFEIYLRESGDYSAILDLNVSISTVVGYVDNEAPITDRKDFNTVANIKGGGVYLLGSIQKYEQNNGSSGFFGSVKKQDIFSGDIQIWASVSRIGAPEKLLLKKFSL